MLRSQQDMGLGHEITVNVHTSNYSCFNLGNTKVQNSHEIKIEPIGILQKAAAEIQKQAQEKAMTPNQNGKSTKYHANESVYQETAPSTQHNREMSRKDLHDEDLKFAKCPPKRLRSYEKESTAY